MMDSVGRAWQSNSTEEEDNEHNIREYCGDVNDFSTFGDALNHAEIDESPCNDES